ncbi:chaperone modulator CbpM [Fluoribacter dumoffii]|uniref:Chaperone-modulator protein CbpM n=1 Tax=Fluoribacter dumoffii TaxID=463 RepID=A0A377GAV2_9GAMM|nr:chaperone modulator CbpM [Fluoribacter dumoffii]KTC88599.1 putative chaperone-modulator protein CbpM [Fluoribacter dumoffii NY 23]MCW8386108.1 chaperone modulator CbpM [Fluoribacter dumoffii]MCW8419160.1 chaperone modulator CbpM [Fluoribacter dumoffii]MCW8452996.1 chaperone modulator CbpM [Fluoribacter dumoffii]MCW8459786.1 chaperone modulator CbpM [Fluoribacter dumoffii]
MKQDNTIIGVLIEETTSISFKEVCQKYHIPKELLIEMVEYGLFSTSTTKTEQLKLTQKDLRKIESAFRLHRDLGINLPGVALALDLLEKIDQLNDELNILRKHF